MSQTIEREFKTMLTAAQFSQLKADYPFAAPFVQTNYYFELPNQGLAKRHWGLRIRLFDTYAEQTLKVPTVENAHSLMEITDRLTLEQATHLIEHQTVLSSGQIAAYFAAQAVIIKELFIWGQATTHRQTASLVAGLLTLDVTQYPDETQDYEVEIEVTNVQGGATWFKSFVTRYQLSEQIPPNKIVRALIHQA